MSNEKELEKTPCLIEHVLTALKWAESLVATRGGAQNNLRCIHMHTLLAITQNQMSAIEVKV